MINFFDKMMGRLRRIMLDAPWDNHDLLTSCVILWIGTRLVLNPDLFDQLSLYRPLSAMTDELGTGFVFIGCGALGLIVALCNQWLSLVVRLLGRMGGAFCMIVLALNSILNPTPPLAISVYAMLAIWSFWGILRTQSSGK